MALGRLFGKKKSTNDAAAQKTKPITIVSGLPRSGTSMMMKMLDAGGLEPLIDNIRTADEDNPKGYYEFERVKGLDKGDKDWLPEAQGKVVKVISALLKHLPDGYQYKVIFMKRRIEENLQSQKKMLIRRGEDPNKVNDDELRAMLEMHLKMVDDWLSKQPNVDLLYVPYHDMVEHPQENIATLNAFLEHTLDTAKMSEIVDGTLYRNRGDQNTEQST